MKPEELDEQLQRADYAPAPTAAAPYTAVGDAMGFQKIDEAGMSYARKWNLVRQDGTVKCMRDHCNGDAQMPTLECLPCRRKRTGA